MQPVETQGPFTDGGGSYYLDVFADGTSEKRYVTSPARPQQSGLAAGTSSIDDAGNLVAPSAPVSQGPVVPAAGQLDAGTINEVTESADTGGGSAPRSGYSRRSSYGGGSGYQSGGGYDDGGGLPAYQNGQFHPSDPRFIPNEMPLGDRIASQVAGPLQGLGAQIAQAAGAVPRGEDYQRPTISSDAGWAGPSGAGVFGGASVSGGQPRSASNPLEGWNGPNSTSGGGGNASPQYDALRAKGDAMRGKIKGMAANIRGGRGGSTSGAAPSGTTTGPSTTQQYRQQGRRMDRANERYNEELYNPDPLKVHGWARRQRFKPGTVEAAMGDPTLILPAAIPGFTARDTAGSNELTSLPMTDLALIMGGTQRKRGLTTKTPVVKPPAILRKQGVKPVKPENKRVLDPSAVVNKVASMYQQVGQGQRPSFLDSNTLLANLASAKKGSILRQNLTTQFEEDPNAAMNSVRSYVTSSLSAGNLTPSQYARAQGVDNTITNLGPQLLRMKPKKASKAVSTIANQYRSGAW